MADALTILATVGIPGALVILVIVTVLVVLATFRQQ